MVTKNIIVIFLLLPILADCRSNIKEQNEHALTQTDTTLQNNYGYPEEIIQLGKEKLFENTKWFLYCLYCDQKVKLINSQIPDTVTYGTLPLMFDKILIINDSIEIDFTFMYKNMRVNEATAYPAPIWGLLYNSQDSIVSFSSMGSMRYSYFVSIKDPEHSKNRKIKPLQPEVIQYIKENKDKLDPWFRKEAIKRGVINE